MERTAGARPKLRLRGVLHEYAFFVSLVVGGVLIAEAPTTKARVGAAVFAAAVAGMFGASALHHRLTWSPRQRRWTRRIDHAGIYLLIAGSYTPPGLLVLGGAWRIAVLIAVWSGVAAAIVLKSAWVEAPKWLSAVIGICLGWGVLDFPQLLQRLGGGGISLLLVGGLLYTLGAIVYALRRPDPLPTVFGLV